MFSKRRAMPLLKSQNQNPPPEHDGTRRRTNRTRWRNDKMTWRNHRTRRRTHGMTWRNDGTRWRNDKTTWRNLRMTRRNDGTMRRSGCVKYLYGLKRNHPKTKSYSLETNPDYPEGAFYHLETSLTLGLNKALHPHPVQFFRSKTYLTPASPNAA